MVERRRISYPVLVDPDAAVMKAYGTYNRYAPLHGHFIPHPSLAIVDREGRLVHAMLRKRVLGRIGTDEILALLDRLGSGAPA